MMDYDLGLRGNRGEMTTAEYKERADERDIAELVEWVVKTDYIRRMEAYDHRLRQERSVVPARKMYMGWDNLNADNKQVIIQRLLPVIIDVLNFVDEEEL